MSSWCTSLAIPKSVTLHFSPSPTRTFLAARSRWIIYSEKKFLNKGFFKNRIKIKIIFFLKLCLGPPHMSPVSKILLITTSYLNVFIWEGGLARFPDLARGFSTRMLETGLKFQIWILLKIGPGNWAHLKRPVNLSLSLQLVKTIA